MKSLSVFAKDVGAAVRNRKVLVTILAVLFIPVLYSGMFLGAFWDPYGKMDELPVAVVNNDTGAEFEGKTLQVGDDLVAELEKSKAFHWEFVDESQAEQGMKDNKYYMTIIIPDNFSKQATTLLDEHPEPARIVYKPNEGYNFLAGQIGGTAVKEIQAKVSAKVTEAYTETLFAQVEKVSGGLSEAGDGANRLSEGAVELDEGAVKLKENLAKLADGTLELQQGIAPLAEGVQELNSGAGSLKTGASSLAAGLEQLQSGHSQLLAGAEEAGQGGAKLQAGLESAAQGSAELKEGLQANKAGAEELAQGAQSAYEGSRQLEQGLNQSLEATASLEQGAKSVADGLKKLVDSNPELAASPEVEQLLAASQALAAGTSELNAGQKQLAQGAAGLAEGTAQLQGGAGKLSAGAEQMAQGGEQLAAGSQELLAGVKQLNAGQGQLVDGMKLFGSKLGEAAAGGKVLAGGAEKLSEGTGQLAAGAGKLGDGVATLADGSRQLDSGAGELVGGMDSLKEGSGELAEKLNEAADKTSSIHTTDETVTMFAGPVQVEEHKVNEVPNYGTGFSPYFLSLGLFVGALISTIILPIRDTTVPNATGWNRFVSRALSFAGMGLIQSLLAVIVMLYGLKLEVQSVPLFYLFSFITSLSFMFLVQMFVTWLDQPGRFVVIIILIMQLTTSAGTFPVELIPDWMKVLNPLLPMTYSVLGFKDVVSTGNFDGMWSSAAVLIGFGVGSLILTSIYFLIRYNRNRSAESSTTATA